MTYEAVIIDGKVQYYQIRSDSGMYCGSAIQNQSPFTGCKAIDVKDAENHARLWTAAPDMLEALEEINNHYSYSNKRVSDNAIDMVQAAILKAKGTNPKTV